MRCAVEVKNVRRILCVFPAYTPSFGTFSGAYSLMKVRAFMPPQGLLVKPAGIRLRSSNACSSAATRRSTGADNSGVFCSSATA